MLYKKDLLITSNFVGLFVFQHCNYYILNIAFLAGTEKVKNNLNFSGYLARHVRAVVEAPKIDGKSMTNFEVSENLLKEKYRVRRKGKLRKFCAL